MLKITGFLLHTIYYAKYSAKYQECKMSESSLLSSRQMESNGKDRWATGKTDGKEEISEGWLDIAMIKMSLGHHTEDRHLFSKEMTCERCHGRQVRVKNQKGEGCWEVEGIWRRKNQHEESHMELTLKLIFKSSLYRGLSLRQVLSSAYTLFWNNPEKQVLFFTLCYVWGIKTARYLVEC